MTDKRLAFALQKHDEKINCLRKVLAINPRNAEARQYLNIHEESKFSAESQKEHKRIISEGYEKVKNNAKKRQAERDYKVVHGDEKPRKPRKRHVTKPTKPPKKYVIVRNKKENNLGDEENIVIPFRKPTIIHKTSINDFFYGFHPGIDWVTRQGTGVFGKTIIVGGVKITPNDIPRCLQLDSNEGGEKGCDYCDFFTPLNCLLKYDEFLAEDLNRLTIIQSQWRAELARRRVVIMEIIHNELKAHGRPLHYAIIAKMVASRYPKLKITEKDTYNSIIWNPVYFERVGLGVYQAR